MWTVSNWKLELFVGPIYLNLNTCFLGNYSLEIWLLKEIISSSHEKKNWNCLKNSMISTIFITSCFFLLSVGMIDLVTQQSANYLIYSLPKQGTIWRPTIPFFVITFLLLFVSMKIVMNPQAVLLLTLVAVPCTSASMLPRCFVC